MQKKIIFCLVICSNEYDSSLIFVVFLVILKSTKWS